MLWPSATNSGQDEPLRMHQTESASGVRQTAGGIVPRMLALVLLFTAAAAWECVALSSLQGSEIWSHLRLGSWILAQHAVPRTGLFSQISQQNWRDFSWGYDTLAAILERILGLRAVPAMVVLFRVVLAVVTFLLAGRRRERFWIAVGVSALAQFAFSTIPLDAANFSIALFGITLLILLEARESGQTRPLFTLPAIFLLWGNLDISFVYGIGLLLLFVAVRWIEGRSGSAHKKWLELPEAPLPIRMVGKITVGCLLASFCNPYGYHAHESFFENIWSKLNGSLPGYTSMSFHLPQDYALLLLTMGAALSLGLRRSRDLFLIGLFVACAFVSFHAERESWLVGLAALAVIGSGFHAHADINVNARATLTNRHMLASAVISLLLVALVFLTRVPWSRAGSLQRVAQALPVRACDYIREHRLAQPLFNPYAWGGFVSWYLPEYPVSIDQRRGLFPEDEEMNYFKMANAEIGYREYAPIKGARTLLLDKQSVMGEALRGMPGFKVAYEDDLSLVLQAPEKE